MAVNEIKMNPEQKALNSADQFSREDEFAKKLVESFDLPSNLANEIDEKIEDEKRGPKKKEDEEEVEESEEVEASEESQESEESEVEESEEDLIPKSKVQARIDELTREKKELSNRLRKLEQQAEEKRTPEDSDLQKLEAMDDAQLKALKRQVKAEQMTAVQSQDRAKLNELMDLEDKIDSVSSNAPKRFADSQIRRFNEAVNETVSDGDIKNFKEASPQIFKKAQEIYAKSSSLKGSVNGQAEAWSLAVEHYKEVSKLSEGRSKNVETERKFNSLKKKVSVDSGVTKGTEQAETDRKTFQKAKHGDFDDKLNFFKKSVISQDMFKPNVS